MKKFSYACIMTAGCLWGLNGLFFRFLSEYGFDQIQITFMKVAVASVLLGLSILVKDPSGFKVRWRDLWIFIGAGMISMLFFNYCYYTSMVYTTVAVTVSLLYTSPGFVVLFSAFLFREKITPRKLAALVILFIGCACASGLFAGPQKVTVAGIFWGLLAGLSYSLYTIFNRFALNRGYSTRTISFYFIFICAVGAIPFCDFGTLASTLTLPAFFIFLANGAFCCVMPYICFTTGMKKLEAGEAAMLATSEPVMAAVASAVLLSEPLSGFVILGIVLIIGGIVLMNIRLKGNGTAGKEC